MKSGLLALVLFCLIASTSWAQNRTVIESDYCVTVDTYINPFKKMATRSCAKKAAIEKAERQCASMGGFVKRSDANVSCSMIEWVMDRYTCSATANVTCKMN